MGIGEMTGGALYIMGEDGQRHPLSFNATMEVTGPGEPEKLYIKRLPEERELTIETLFYPKRASRKRFVKQLMASGVQRNAAEAMAAVSRQYSPYGHMLMYLQLGGFM